LVGTLEEDGSRRSYIYIYSKSRDTLRFLSRLKGLA